jgi:hypothetical protein
MSTGGNDSYVAGQGIVKIVVIALLLLLVADRFGIPISWLGFICAMTCAIIFYGVFWLLWRRVVRKRE